MLLDKAKQTDCFEYAFSWQYLTAIRVSTALANYGGTSNYLGGIVDNQRLTHVNHFTATVAITVTERFNMFTIGRTAKQAGVRKATLTRAFRSRRNSANKNAKTGWDSAMKRNAPTASTKIETPKTAVLMVRLDAEIDWLKAQAEQLKMMRKQLDKMKVQRDEWQDQAQSAQRRGWFGFRKAS